MVWGTLVMEEDSGYPEPLLSVTTDKWDLTQQSRYVAIRVSMLHHHLRRRVLAGFPNWIN